VFAGTVAVMETRTHGIPVKYPRCKRGDLWRTFAVPLNRLPMCLPKLYHAQNMKNMSKAWEWRENIFATYYII
jgi:hypothetical protein